MANFYIYRVGLECLDRNGHRAMFSEQWHADTPEVSVADTFSSLTYCANQLYYPFGNVAGLHYSGWVRFAQCIWPQRNWTTLSLASPSAGATPLNSAAPEAAFRLQRVGDGSPPGRICLPILTDTYYTDFPTRRTVDVATLGPLLAANLEAAPKTFTATGRTYTKVIFHRQALTFTIVDHYELRENPVRLWQRWRNYPQAAWAARDLHWVPSELGSGRD